MRAIGRCAVSLEAAAERCINVLLELIRSKVNYVVQEAVIVIKVRAWAGAGGAWTKWECRTGVFGRKVYR